ncbi:MAG: DUF4345 domain-containing protein [Pseudomonadota bacterium]|nr:DUF4345 domain-containing protein [Pseudomonadota bacterium]
MTADAERRLLQFFTALACLVPISAGTMGVLDSAAMLPGVEAPLPINLDSHYRYLSGLLLGIGIGFALCIRDIEVRAPLYRFLGMIVVVGGLGRLLSFVEMGPPGFGHRFGLTMELVVVPLLMVWQARVARRSDGRKEQALPKRAVDSSKSL